MILESFAFCPIGIPLLFSDLIVPHNEAEKKRKMPYLQAFSKFQQAISAALGDGSQVSGHPRFREV